MPDHEPPAIPLRAKLVLVFVASFAAIQVLVPIVRLAEPRPARFGWQMFATVEEPPAFWVVEDDGAAQPVALQEHVGYARGDLDYLPWLPRHLCDTVPEAVAVRYQAADASMEESACP